jgi:hypothetical protein
MYPKVYAIRPNVKIPHAEAAKIGYLRPVMTVLTRKEFSISLTMITIKIWTDVPRTIGKFSRVF